ncbi:hypothetical protein Desti_2920 [Desulfomonile tiedjei DSM 6799]|uniref:Uncharacterized protein n=1 Tax=Desulfomonile tiedjei (strain ATCC 49306 / DSM 6799 / DCB-1) TaxID=706587 RepID=I4C7P8_DESTA|nr:hypothetical protein Desti_2920 [Desulfomonile tiedjei DSM 6799]
MRSRHVSEAKSGGAVRSEGDMPGPVNNRFLNIPFMKAHWYVSFIQGGNRT